MKEELPTIDIIQYKVKLVPCLKGVMETNKEWMSEVLQQDVPLCHNVFHLISLDDGLLLQYLDGIVLARCLVFAQVHLNAHKHTYTEIILAQEFL